MNNQIIRQSIEEVLKELDLLREWKFNVKSLLAPRKIKIRQIRLFNSNINDKGIVINYQSARGDLNYDLKQLKQRVRNHLLQFAVN